MAYQKGQSGNPAGKPPGANKTQKVRAKLMSAVPDILTALVEQAKTGDATAARLILERTLPALRPVDAPAVLALPPDATIPEQARAIIAATLTGKLPANQAATLLTALAGVAQLAEDAPSSPLTPAENLARVHELAGQLGFKLLERAGLPELG